MNSDPIGLYLSSRAAIGKKTKLCISHVEEYFRFKRRSSIVAGSISYTGDTILYLLTILRIIFKSSKEKI